VPKALVVDDSPVDRRLAGRILERNGEMTSLYANNGVDALAAVAENAPDVLVTDLQMPDMNGLELVKEIRNHYPSTPVVLMTAYGSEEVAVEALQAGAAGYVPKKNLARDLVRIIENVLAAAQENMQKDRLFDHMARAEFEFVLENDPDCVRPLVAHLRDCLTPMGLCDEAERIRVATALHEALDNALFHGNLEMRSEQRQEGEEAYRNVASERAQQSPFRDRRIFVRARFSRSEAVFIIRDEGRGFDPSTLPDPTDPANILKSNGRGLLLIRAFMDEVSHNKTGNEITLVKKRQA